MMNKVTFSRRGLHPWKLNELKGKKKNQISFVFVGLLKAYFPPLSANVFKQWKILKGLSDEKQSKWRHTQSIDPLNVITHRVS